MATVTIRTQATRDVLYRGIVRLNIFHTDLIRAALAEDHEPGNLYGFTQGMAAQAEHFARTARAIQTAELGSTIDLPLSDGQLIRTVDYARHWVDALDETHTGIDRTRELGAAAIHLMAAIPEFAHVIEDLNLDPSHLDDLR